MKTKLFIILFSIILIALVYFKFLNYDLGFTGDYFIERTFNEAFNHLKKGECEEFNSYLAQGSNLNYCENSTNIRRQSNILAPNLEYLYAMRIGPNAMEVFFIAHGLIDGKKISIPSSYEMVKEGFHWKLKIS